MFDDFDDWSFLEEKIRTPKESKKISDEDIRKAIDFILPGCSEELINKLLKFINKQISTEDKNISDVSILWDRDPDFLNLIRNSGIDIGKKEVVITKSYIRVSNHYNFEAPKLFI